MWRKPSDTNDETPARESFRYYIPFPMQIELRTGLMSKKRVPARAVDLSQGGASCHVRPNEAFQVGKRFRIFVDDVPGFIEVRNVRPGEDGLMRVGMSFVQLELVTQERIVDTLEQAKKKSSRIDS